ncbi:MAG: zf-HC2 domain-containing protein [Thermomicrobium sp.]|nr:zf-HC2 domain-containing protein [Thermomicrobium sp.]
MAPRGCRSFRPLLSAYLDGELSDEERQRLLTHLARCADCHRRLREYEELRERLRRLPAIPPPPRHLQREIWERLTDVEASQRRHHRLRATFLATALSVTLLLATLLSVTVGLQRSQPPRIVASSPAAGTTQLWPIYQPIEIVFSKPMNEQSVLMNLRISPPGERERLPISWSGTTLIIGADSERRVALLPDTVYQVAVLSTAEDRWGRPLGTTYAVTFRTTSAIIHAGETPVPTPSQPQPRPPAESEEARPAPAPHTTPTPIEQPASPTPPARSTPVHTPAAPAAPNGPAPLPQPSPTVTVSPTPQPTPLPTPTPTPVPEPTSTPEPVATPEPIPVTGAFGRVYWSDQTIQQRLGNPTTPAFVVNAAELVFQRGVMIERFDTLTVYVLEASGTWRSVPEPAPIDPPLEFRSIEPNLWLPGGTFGQVWEALALAEPLGYATEASIHMMTAGARVQNFERGTLMLSDRGFVYALFDDGTWKQFPVTN